MTKKRPLRRGGPGRRIRKLWVILRCPVTEGFKIHMAEMYGVNLTVGEMYTNRWEYARQNFDGYKYLTDAEKERLLFRGWGIEI